MSKAPGKSHREGITIIQLMKMFPDEEAARKWFEMILWPNGPECPHCGSNNASPNKNQRPMPYRCRTCRKHYSVRQGTIMEESRLPLQKWALAIYMVCTNLKSVSSMKLHRDLGISQRSAWFMMHRIREAFPVGFDPFAGPVEVDETYIGGKRKNMPKSKRKQMTGRGAVGKTAVVGAKDRDTNQVSVKVVKSTDAPTLQSFVHDRTEPDAQVYTDDARAYVGMDRAHESVNHSAGEYVRAMAHTNGMESFWAVLKRGYQGTFHHFSAKHMQRYVTEFAGRHNDRESDTINMMTHLVAGMVGKRLTYKALTHG